MASDQMTGNIYHPQAQGKTTNMWKFNRGVNKNASAPSQKHDKNHNRGSHSQPKQDNKRQKQGEYSINQITGLTNLKQIRNEKRHSTTKMETKPVTPSTIQTKQDSPMVGLDQLELMSIINEVITEGIRATQQLPFRFENTTKAAAHNAKIWAAHDFDMA